MSWQSCVECVRLLKEDRERARKREAFAMMEREQHEEYLDHLRRVSMNNGEGK